jgi:hypothetical protein
MHGTLGPARGNPAGLLRSLAGKANAEARAAETKFRESVAHAIRCGEYLLKAQAVLRAAEGYGKWEAWLRQNFEKGVSTARLYMQLAGRIEDDPALRQRVSEVPLRDALKVLDQKRLLQTTEHYTPAKYLEAVRLVLGGIDLDPASCAQANATVRATRYFTKAQDGPSQPWHGRVWCNPPYCRQAHRFVEKLLTEYRAGNVKAGILLLNGFHSDSAWFKPLWDFTFCFTDHTIKFNTDEQYRDQPNRSSIFIYLGPDPDAFEREFKQFGAVMTRYRGAA